MGQPSAESTTAPNRRHYSVRADVNGYDDTPESDDTWGNPPGHWSADIHRSAEHQTLRKQFRHECAHTRNADGSYGAPCWRCPRPIDYRLEFPHPGSFSVDHYQPVQSHPELALKPANFRAFHLRCNQSRRTGSYGDDDETDLDIGEPSEIW
jgi:hypothetical protein